MTRSQPIVTCTPVLQRSQVALRCIVALAALAAVPTARADAPTTAQPVSTDMSEKTGPSGQVADTATSPRCQDRRDVKWIRRCLPERNTWELGVFAGVNFPAASSHELFDAYKQREARWMGQGVTARLARAGSRLASSTSDRRAAISRAYYAVFHAGRRRWARDQGLPTMTSHVFGQGYAEGPSSRHRAARGPRLACEHDHRVAWRVGVELREGLGAAAEHSTLVDVALVGDLAGVERG